MPATSNLMASVSSSMPFRARHTSFLQSAAILSASCLRYCRASAWPCLVVPNPVVRVLCSSLRHTRSRLGDLTAAQRAIIQRVAITGAVLEDMAATWLATGQLDATLWATLTNVERRLYETIGLKRTPRDVTSLGQILKEATRG
jgi:hypothetical protein